jgi:hypothetical protein
MTPIDPQGPKGPVAVIVAILVWVWVIAWFVAIVFLSSSPH